MNHPPGVLPSKFNFVSDRLRLELFKRCRVVCSKNNEHGLRERTGISVSSHGTRGSKLKRCLAGRVLDFFFLLQKTIKHGDFLVYGRDFYFLVLFFAHQ